MPLVQAGAPSVRQGSATSGHTFHAACLHMRTSPGLNNHCAHLTQCVLHCHRHMRGAQLHIHSDGAAQRQPCLLRQLQWRSGQERGSRVKGMCIFCGTTSAWSLGNVGGGHAGAPLALRTVRVRQPPRVCPPNPLRSANKKHTNLQVQLLQSDDSWIVVHP